MQNIPQITNIEGHIWLKNDYFENLELNQELSIRQPLPKDELCSKIYTHELNVGPAIQEWLKYADTE